MTASHDDIAIEDDSHWTEGDFTIISSDNVRFKTMLYHLMATRYAALFQEEEANGTSKVFADAWAVASEDKLKVVHLTDHQIETAAVVREFLVLTTTWTVSDDMLPRLDKLVLFLKKFDCPGPIALLRRGWGDGPGRALDTTSQNCHSLFVAAAHLDDLAMAASLCRQMIQLSGNFSVGDMANEIGIPELLQLPSSYQCSVITTLVKLARCRTISDFGDQGWSHLLQQLQPGAAPPEVRGPLLPRRRPQGSYR